MIRRSAVAVLRDNGLALDDLVEFVTPVLGKLARSSVHPLLVRQGRIGCQRKSSRTPVKWAPSRNMGQVHLHMDLFYLPKLEETRRYCFVAIDRATRLVYLSVFGHKDAACAEAFLKSAWRFSRSRSKRS